MRGELLSATLGRNIQKKRKKKERKLAEAAFILEPNKLMLSQ